MNVKKITIISLLAIILVVTIPSADAVINNPAQIVQINQVCEFGDISNNSHAESLAVSGGYGYAVWSSGTPLTCQDHELKFSVSFEGGAWSTPVVIGGDLDKILEGHSIRASGIVVDVVFIDRYDNSQNAEIKHVRSSNAGVTWTSETVVFDLSGGGTGNNIWYFDVDGNTISIIFHDDTDSSTHIVTSTNGGTSWNTPVEIDDGLGGAGKVTGNQVERPVIDVEGTSIIAGYSGTDNINSDEDYWMTNSTDSGVTFAIPVIVSGTGSGGEDMQPRIYRDGTDILLIHKQTNDWTTNLSTDNGVTYGAETTFLTAGVVCSQDLQLAQDPVNLSNIHATCQGVGFDDVFYGKTIDFGTIWSSMESVTDDPLDSTRATEIEAYDSEVWISYERIDDNPSGNEFVCNTVLVRSDNNGFSFTPEEDIIDASCDFGDPHLKTDGEMLFLLMTNENDPSADLYSWDENIPDPDAFIPAVFSGTASQVSFGGDVTNADSISTPEAVYWIWEENSHTELFFSFSTNGETNTPILIRDTEGGSLLHTDDRVGTSSIFADGNDVFVMYRLDNFGTDTSALKISNDGGATFGSEIIVDTDVDGVHLSRDGDEHKVMKKSTDGDLFIFKETEDGVFENWNIEIHKSNDNGLSWVKQGELDGFAGGSGSGSGEHYDPENARDSWIVDGNIIHGVVMAYHEATDTQTHFYIRSADEGLNWTSVNISDPSFEGDSQTPVIIKEGDKLLTLVMEHDDGNLKFNHSDDNGVTWCAEDDYCGEVDTYESGLCSWENAEFDQDWDHSHLAGTETVVVMCGSRSSSNSAYMTLSDDMGVSWSAVTEIDATLPANRSELFSSDEQKENMAFSWYVQTEDNEFQVNSVRATLPDEISDFSSVTSIYDENFGVWIGDDGDFPERKFKEPSVHIAGQGLWISWIGQINSAQSQDLYFTFESFPNASNENPILTLIGASTIFLNVGDTYVEQNSSCVDAQDGVLIPTISGETVNTSVADTYTVLYDCIDTDLNEATQKSRDIIVVLNGGVELTLVDIICDGDTTLQHSEFVQFLEICGIQGADPPVITIIGDVIQEVVIGTSFSDDGSTAFDNGDGDLTSEISVVGAGSVDVNTVGSYLITYNVDDTNGNSAVEKIRTVLVVSAGTSGGGGSTGGGTPTGSPVSSTVDDEGTGVEGFTDEQQLAFEEALANAIASIPLTEDTPLEEFIQTFFEFQVVDDVHEGLVLQSFLDDERLGLRWSTGDDIVLIEAVVAENPFLITFEQFPIVKDGSGAFVSTNSLIYNLEVPRNLCGDTVSLSCVQKIRYEIPVTVQAVIDGVQVQDTGTITVDLTEEDINVILLLVVAVGAIPVGAVLINRLRGKPSPLTTSRRIQG